MSLKAHRQKIWPVLLLMATTWLHAQQLEITSWQNGALTWNASSVTVCTVEWASDLLTPDWSSDWSALRGLPVTNQVMSVKVPQFYRITAAPSTNALLSTANTDAIQQIVQNAVNNYEIPGITYAIKFYGHEPYKGAAGYADSPGTIPMQPDHLMRIGSASKTFVSMSILKLAREGKCWLDQPILQILPTLTNTMDNYNLAKVTIRMLIQHTSGIANFTDSDDWGMEYITSRTNVWTDNELLAIVNNGNTNGLRQVGTPGERWFYSNSNYILLGMIVESLSGTNVGAYITSTFINPLGLTHTYYPTPGQSWPSADGNASNTYAYGYANWSNYFGVDLPFGWTDVTQYDPSGVGAAGPMISTASDLTRWVEAIATNRIGIGAFHEGVLNWRTFIANPTSTNWWQSSTNWNMNMDYGLGLAHELDSNNNANYYIVGHRGQIGGYDAGVMVLPEKGCAIAVICNRSLQSEPGWPNNANRVALSAIVNVLYPDLITNGQLPGGEPMKASGIKSMAAPVVKQRPLMEYP